MTDFTYDVALSFAGENRSYVQAVADFLKENNVSVFYDKYEEAELWGKDLYVHLSEVYSKEAKYCILFISEHYAKKLWTNHERQSAQERAFKEKGEAYILPARFDDTEIPGIRLTTGYVDLRTKTPEDFGQIVLKKLNVTPESTSTITVVNPSQNQTTMKFSGLENFHEFNCSLFAERGEYPQGIPYKETFIGPSDEHPISVRKSDIHNILRNCMVNLEHWGGAPYPYVMDRMKQVRLKEGLLVYDNEKWPFSENSYSGWIMNDRAYFLQREFILEDHGEEPSQIKNKLSVEWALKDICTPILFVRKLSNHLNFSGSIAVNYKWTGLKGRSLILLNRRRHGFYRDYINNDMDVFEHRIIVEKSNDLRDEVLRTVRDDLFWYFGWTPEKEAENTLARDIDLLFSGKLPV